MPKRRSMTATAPKGVDVFFVDTTKQSAEQKEREENRKTTVYISDKQRDYLDTLRRKLRKTRPGLTQSAIIRFAIDTISQMDEEQVSSALERYHDGVMA